MDIFLKNLKSERRNAIPFAFLFVILIVLDQLVKKYATNIFQNNNFAFSLPVPGWLMYLIYASVLVGMVYYCAKNYHELGLLSGLAWVLIFAGAVSNISERIITGHVRDFIYITLYKWTGIYNLADGYIILGIILLLIFSGKHSHTNDIQNF